jgi:hypothetical protein
MEAHQWTLADLQVPRHFRKWIARTLALSSAVLSTACGLTGPFPGVPDLHSPGRLRSQPVEIAAPQVAYRIDENRYFEIVPYGPGACTSAMVHFVDKAKGIRSEAVKLDPGSMGSATLVIDASNDQYLVAPVTRGNTDCSSGGGLCGGSKLPYSTDGGRTWKRANPMFSGDDIYLSGEDVYVSADGRSGQTAKLSAKPQEMESWSRFNLMKTPPTAPTKQPLDSKFHCIVNGKE